MMMLSKGTVSLTQKTCLIRQFPISSRSLSSLDEHQVTEADKTKTVRAPKIIRHTKKELPVGKIPPMNVHLAVLKLRENAWAKFDETVELSVNLGVDPRKPNQSIKGVAKLPHGTGKKIRVAVFANGVDATAALAAGADVVGSDDLIKRVMNGEIPFDTVIATPEMMPQLSKIGRILGPRGMMPNPRMGTVTRDVTKAILAAKAGAVQFRVEKNGIVQAGIGKLSFSDEKLLENLRSFMVAISDAKPEGLKSKYIETVHLSSSMGPGVEITTQNVDPSNAKFMLDPTKMGKMK